ncbi:MAG: hypothetical protein M0Z51_13400 [Propionibacterium sp.]|nr:hypothetical protein [Propionibacterium sp.]
MADPVDIITLQDAKTFLNIDTTASDAELAEFITAASQMWSSRGLPGNSVGTLDEWYDGGAPEISLRHAPVVSVTSVVETIGTIAYTLAQADPGASSSAWTYSVDPTTGLLVRRAAGIAVAFYPGVRNVHVTYTAGYATVPADIQHAIKLLVKHLWTTQRGGGRRPGAGGGDDTTNMTAYSWPWRVDEIARAYYVPGIA